MHQAYLDLVTAGTASLLFEEAQPGEPSAFRFTAVPIEDVVLEEGPSGALDRTFRRAQLTAAQMRARFPAAALPEVDRSEEHTSELPSLMRISYAVFCFTKTKDT